MLVIRREQLEVFEDVAWTAFQEDLIAHVRRSLPWQSEIIQASGVRKVVALALKRAVRHGFTNKGPIRLYAELMFLLGSDFDTDPQCPWAADILNDRTVSDEMDRAHHLFVQFEDYNREVCGLDDVRRAAALRRLIDQTTEVPSEGDTWERDTILLFDRISPEKCAYIGEPAMTQLIQRSKDEAGLQGITSGRCIALLSLLMFTFGHGCLVDPQYPWMATSLEAASAADPGNRTDQLQATTVDYCNDLLLRM